ncbi:MAG: chromate transporter [Clostridiales bacterium]|nr:chromate transporter [Clostridiales bacterium]
MNKEKAKGLLNLFLCMLKIGVVAFGGGYAIVALLETELITRRKWVTHDDFMDMVGIAESTPGPIATNTATFVGYRLYGVLGSVAATVGVCLPAFILMYIVSVFYNMFKEIAIVSAAFKGIQICVIYLIASAGFRMFKKLKKNTFAWIVLTLTFCCMILSSLFEWNISTLVYVFTSAVAGFVCYMLGIVKEEQK